MALLVRKHGVGEGGDERGLAAVVGPVPEAEEGREEAGDDEDGEEDDERGGEGGRRHADVALLARRPRLRHRRVQVDHGVVLALLDGEGEVAARHHLDHLLHAHVKRY